MERQVENKFVWVIKHAISLLSITESDLFVIAGCKWYTYWTFYYYFSFLCVFVHLCHGDSILLLLLCRRLSAHPKEDNLDFFYQYCGVADPNEPLPSRWRRYVKLRLRIVNRLSERPSIVTGDSIYNSCRSLIWSILKRVLATKSFSVSSHIILFHPI